MADLHCHLGLAVGVHEIDDALPGGLLLVIPDAGAARGDAGIGGDAGHFGHHQRCAAEAARRVMLKVEVAGHAVGRRIGAHRRHHDAVAQGHAAQLEWREHRRQRLFAGGRRHAAAGGEPAVVVLGVGRVAQLLVGVTDALAAGQQRESELVGLHIDVVIDFLEPGHAIARRALQLKRLDFAFRLVASEAGRHITICAVQHLDQGRGVFHRQLGTGTDGEMRGVRGVTQQHDIFLEPALAEHAVELDPGRRSTQVPGIGDQPGAVEHVGEEFLAEGDRLIRLQLVESGLEPGFLRCFDDEGGPFVVELVGMQVEPARLGLLEGESEGVELLLGAEPDEATLADVDARVEVVGVFGARSGIDAIGADDQVVFPGIVVRILEFGFKLQVHAEFPGAGLEDLEQFQATDAAVTMTAGNDAPALEEDVAIVPVMEIAFDLGDHLRIVLEETVHGLVGEHDAPAEGAVGLVALDHSDVGGRIGLLHQDREIQARGAAA